MSEKDQVYCWIEEISPMNKKNKGRIVRNNPPSDIIEQGLRKNLIRLYDDNRRFDATGKPTKVNELDEIGVALADFIKKEAVA